MITLSYRILGGDFDSAGLATRKLKEQLAKIGVGAPVMRRAMIASYEAEMNVVIHARTGTLWARLDEEKLDLEVTDEGPGIPDVQLALREGWSTASSQARRWGSGQGWACRISERTAIFSISRHGWAGEPGFGPPYCSARGMTAVRLPPFPPSCRWTMGDVARACAASSPAPRRRFACTGPFPSC